MFIISGKLLVSCIVNPINPYNFQVLRPSQNRFASNSCYLPNGMHSLLIGLLLIRISHTVHVPYLIGHYVNEHVFARGQFSDNVVT